MTTENYLLRDGADRIAELEAEVSKWRIQALYETDVAEAAFQLVKEVQAQRDKLLAELKNVVSCCESHDKAIGKILGTPPGWRDAYLDPARAAIAKVEGK